MHQTWMRVWMLFQSTIPSIIIRPNKAGIVIGRVCKSSIKLLHSNFKPNWSPQKIDLSLTHCGFMTQACDGSNDGIIDSGYCCSNVRHQWLIDHHRLLLPRITACILPMKPMVPWSLYTTALKLMPMKPMVLLPLSLLPFEVNPSIIPLILVPSKAISPS